MDQVGNAKTLGKETTEKRFRVCKKNGVQTRHGRQQDQLIKELQADARSGPFTASVGVDGGSGPLLVLLVVALSPVVRLDFVFFFLFEISYFNRSSPS